MLDAVIRCAGCRNWLGVIQAGEVVVRHRKREIRGATQITCEKCGGVWRELMLKTVAPAVSVNTRLGMGA